MEENTSSNIKRPRRLASKIAVKVSPHNYLIGILVFCFLSAFLVYLGHEIASVLLLIATLGTFAFLIWQDKIVFDGRRIYRKGIFPRISTFFTDTYPYLKLKDVEQVETQAIRTIKRGSNVYYGYTTTIKGRGLTFTFASGKNYREMLRAILPLLPENILDNRSLELRDYNAERRATLNKAASFKIPGSDVLEYTMLKRERSLPPRRELLLSHPDKINELRVLANELRINGSLPQAVEAFRRALLLNPTDGWLLFEFARCLQSFAGAKRDEKVARRAAAMLRLAERRAANDSRLLARLGETYFQFGDVKRATKVFQRSVDDLGESFRALRGMAEISLREGKIAHVIHHFASAANFAETSALKRWTKREAEYFSNLNNNAEYMELEISRVNMIESVSRTKSTAFRAAIVGFPLIIFGVLSESTFAANAGWAISGLGLAIWLILTIVSRTLTQRIPFDLVEED